ncbi:MAG: isoleucine--tRNA ligase [SAR86 cluster bacterium]|nr:isoleucine--tRNA ligase [SAR86 cluster bacterium]
MKKYKDTLNLPKTDFSMKANLPNREPEMLKYWDSINLHKKLELKGQNKPVFILHDGPPYANGAIHLGHSVNKVLKDIVIKSQTLDGKYSPYIPGWDCHGLPIELNVEKKLGKVGHKVSAVEFREACRSYASKQIEIQKKEFARLGVLARWENSYLSMDFKFEANIVRSLGKIVEKGFLERGEKPVHWCSSCGSALAEAEVEYQDKISTSIDFGFPLDAVDLEPIFKKSIEGPILAASWTTTPWTLPGNVALCVNGELEYSLIKVSMEAKELVLLVAKDLIKATLERIGISKFEELANCSGQNLEGLTARHPYLDRKSKIILGDHVTIDAGTGIVHTAPGHGMEDFIAAKDYNLSVINPIKDNGTFKEDVEHVGGMFAFKSNEKIIEVLRHNNTLFSCSNYEHSYPHCWRHKTPLMFRATPQWFVGMKQKDLLNKTINSIEKVKWEPTWGKGRMSGMLEGRPDWCISRQRAWGVPITLLIHDETNELHPNMSDIITKVALLIEKGGIDAWHQVDIKELDSNVKNYKKVTDCLDVWFDSGVTHECVLNDDNDLEFPADLYLEGSDQHRGWFQSSLLTSIAINDSAPYKSVLTHGFVVDSEGKKMSKSIGNVISPQQVWDSKGADVLRAWISATDYRNEMVVSEEILQRSADSYRRIRNTIRFLLGNLHDYDDSRDALDIKDLAELDKWMITRTKNLQEEIIDAFSNYQFHIVFQKIQNFCTNDLGGFYLDILKDRLYTSKGNSIARRSSQTALYKILGFLLRAISPILSFTAEEAWRSLKPKSDSIFLEEWSKDWPSIKEGFISNKDWELILLIRTEVNKVLESSRNSGLIGSSLDAEIHLYCSKEIESVLEKFEEELRFIFITSEAKIFELGQHGEGTNMDGLRLKVLKSEHDKCERCWHSRPEVGSVENHPSICKRCIENIEDLGEIRKYA